MTQNCMVCSKELTSVICEGKIGDMTVTFCDEDAKHCGNCETITCRNV